MLNQDESTPATHMLVVDVPVRARSLNESLGAHWRGVRKKAKLHRHTTHMLLKRHAPKLPCVITLTRIAPSNGLDGHDNVQGSLKHVADGVADWLGVADSDARIQWRYSQERGTAYSVRVSVETAL